MYALNVLALNPDPGDIVKPEYVLDGRRTITLTAFYAEVSQVLLSGQPWGENLDALHAVLRGNYGFLPETFRLVWRDAKVAQAALGYPETVHQLKQRLRDCHPTILIKTAWALRAALQEQGPTVYDWLVELIGEHPNVELVLIESDEPSHA
jgi:RNAse (barnase) inhibitor barstar